MKESEFYLQSAEMGRFFKHGLLRRNVVITAEKWNGTKGHIEWITPQWNYVNVKVTEGPNTGMILALKPNELKLNFPQ